MKPAWTSFIIQKKGFTLLELLFSFTLLAILISSYTAIQKNMTYDIVLESQDCEQMLQMITAMENIKNVCLQAYAVEVLASTSHYSKQFICYLKDELDNTKTVRFYLNLENNILYESIQANSSPGVLQLAVEMASLDFKWQTQAKEPLLEITLQGKLGSQQKIQRLIYLRNAQQ